MVDKEKSHISCVTYTAEKVYVRELNHTVRSLTGDVEITLVAEGSGIYRGPEEARECHAGDLFVFDSGLPHVFFAKSKTEKPLLRTVSFNPEKIFDLPESERGHELFCGGVFLDKRPSVYAMLNAAAKEKINSLFTSISDELSSRDFQWESAAKLQLSMLLLTVSRYLRLAETVSTEHRTVHPKEWSTVSLAIKEIMENFSDGNMTLDSIAGKLFISRSHMSRIFTKVTGSSFTDYVRDVRISHACELLKTTRLSNEEIVRKCGLRDIPSFYKLFKASLGLTPYQYRLKKHSQKGEKTMSIYTEISENLQRGKAKIVKELVAKAIEDGLPAGQILNEALVSGMNVIGEKFKNNEVYVPEVLVAARAMNAGMQLLQPLLIEDGVQSSGKVCIGTVQGDLHDIGKNLVKMMMEGKGLEVIDLGTDVPPETFIKTAIDENCRVICCSALLTTTMDVMADVVKAAETAGIRDKVKIMVGGAPISDEFCKKIGADCYTTDAASAADAAVELCK